MNLKSKVISLLTLSGLSRRWQVAVCISVGIAIGMVVVLARVSNATSYLSDSPKTCMNCHVMTDAFASWQRGSHGKFTTCLDCHVPHSNIIAKTAFKAADGMKHSYIFLTRTEPQVIRLSEAAIPVVQANCLRCHADQFEMVRLAKPSERTCWGCHSTIHGKVHSLSASPKTLAPPPPKAGL